jgi:hypothetical protein
MLSRSAYKKTLLIGEVCFSLMQDDDQGWWTKDGNLLVNSVKLRHVVQLLVCEPYQNATRTALLEESYRASFQIVRQSKAHGLKVTRNFLRTVIGCYAGYLSFWFSCCRCYFFPGADGYRDAPEKYSTMCRRFFLNFEIRYCTLTCNMAKKVVHNYLSSVDMIFIRSVHEKNSLGNGYYWPGWRLSG